MMCCFLNVQFQDQKVKHWFKPIFPLFQTSQSRKLKFLTPMADFAPSPAPLLLAKLRPCGHWHYLLHMQSRQVKLQLAICRLVMKLNGMCRRPSWLCLFRMTVSGALFLFSVYESKLTGKMKSHIHFQARSENCEKILLALSCLSVCPHETSRLPLDVFLWSLTFDFFFSKIRLENSTFIKIGKE